MVGMITCLLLITCVIPRVITHCHWTRSIGSLRPSGPVVCFAVILNGVSAPPGKSWKSWIFYISMFWRVLKNDFGPGKSWKLNFKVLECTRIYSWFKLTNMPFMYRTACWAAFCHLTINEYCIVLYCIDLTCTMHNFTPCPCLHICWYWGNVCMRTL